MRPGLLPTPSYADVPVPQSLPILPSATAARLFLGAQGLLEDPARRATTASLQGLIERLGFVQVDTINVLARAHDLTLFSRLDGYRPEQLKKLLEGKRSLFEGFTHDASAIPTAFFRHWKPRFERDRARFHAHAWWQYHFRGTDGAQVVKDVKARIEGEGPLKSSDFEHPEKRGPWWGWKPQKAALDFLWRSGELMIPRREGFQKVYDLTERVLPDHHALPCPDPEEHLEWACSTAADRLWVFTPKEAGRLLGRHRGPGGQGLVRHRRKGRRIAAVKVEDTDGAVRPAFALADWEAAAPPWPPRHPRAHACSARSIPSSGTAPGPCAASVSTTASRPSCLSPSARTGYFVLPILEGDRLVGRLDSKLHRDRGLLEIKGLWEPGVKATRARNRRLEEALDAPCQPSVEAEEVYLP